MQRFLKSLGGRWSGNCKTWFQPGELADESVIEGEFEPIHGDVTVRHTYRSTIRNGARHGEEWIAWNAITKQFEVCWLDSFHMNYSIMYSTGEATPAGFSVLGSYDFEAGTPAWGWRTEYALTAEDELQIQSFNVTPEGEEALAVKIEYRRA